MEDRIQKAIDSYVDEVEANKEYSVTICGTKIPIHFAKRNRDDVEIEILPEDVAGIILQMERERIDYDLYRRASLRENGRAA